MRDSPALARLVKRSSNELLCGTYYFIHFILGICLRVPPSSSSVPVRLRKQAGHPIDETVAPRAVGCHGVPLARPAPPQHLLVTARCAFLHPNRGVIPLPRPVSGRALNPAFQIDHPKNYWIIIMNPDCLPHMLNLCLRVAPDDETAGRHQGRKILAGIPTIFRQAARRLRMGK